MNTTHRLVPALFALLTCANCGSSPATAQNEEAAKEAALSWLALVDAGRYGESWEAAAGFFRAATTKADWEASLAQIFAQLGERQSRELIAAKYTTSLPNAPEGEYVVIQYDTAYEKAETVETVTMLKEGDAWKTIGYFVRPA